ncbi:hypothetical protein EDC94DRAFT_581271 [Helicostylum pulchrum]|nr:hypothetical protein EDC94DRAFT_581271 [Helicostylum pulchrum]
MNTKLLKALRLYRIVLKTRKILSIKEYVTKISFKIVISRSSSPTDLDNPYHLQNVKNNHCLDIKPCRLETMYPLIYHMYFEIDESYGTLLKLIEYFWSISKLCFRSLYYIILLKKGPSYPDIKMDNLYRQMLEFHKCDAKTEKETFDDITEVFRGVGDVPDRDKLKIKLFKIYEEAEKEDRKVIDVLVNLCVKLLIIVATEEQELIDNFVDPILSLLLHKPEKEKLFLWLDRTVTKSYNTRPDAGCTAIHKRRVERFSCFAGVKDLLRLALFGMNEIGDNDAKCILLVQVIDNKVVITRSGIKASSLHVGVIKQGLNQAK